MDLLPAQYAAKIMVQTRRQEPIDGLDQAVREMIFNFRKRNGCLPTRIIMYRDGVGESMFLKVRDTSFLLRLDANDMLFPYRF